MSLNLYKKPAFLAFSKKVFFNIEIKRKKWTFVQEASFYINGNGKIDLPHAMIFVLKSQFTE